MNTIFIDFKSKDPKEKESINNIKKIVTNKIFKYIVNDDILNNSLSKIIYIRIDREYINNQLQKGKYSIYDKILKLNINRKYGKNDVVHLIFANEFDDCKVIKEYILRLFRLNNLTVYEELNIKNNLKRKDVVYMDKYINDNKIVISYAEEGISRNAELEIQVNNIQERNDNDNSNNNSNNFTITDTKSDSESTSTPSAKNDSTIANTEIPKAGQEKKIICIVVIVISIGAIYFNSFIKKYRNVWF